MLLFADGEIVMLQEGKEVCLCKRRASWEALLKDSEDMVPMCAWCILYSGKSKWGHDNRDEILHVGRAAQEQALKVKRSAPELDQHGRVLPQDAEKFLLGVAFTVKLMSKMGMPMKYLADSEGLS